MGLCCRDPALGTTDRIDRQVGGAAEERRGRGESSAGLRPACRLLELDCEVLVGPSRRVRTVPRPAVRLELGIGRVRQCTVDAAALGI